MQAFLFAVLNALPGPKVNAPSLGCLYAPYIRATSWMQLARTLDLDSDADRAADIASTRVEVTVVEERVWGAPNERLHSATKQLARLAGVMHLRVGYSVTPRDVRFLGADPYPRLEREDIGIAMIDCCRGGTH
jgi:hypothetical protein